MEIDKDINKNDKTLEFEYIKKSIYIIHYPKGKLSVSYGLTDKLIEGKTINHCCNTEEGSSGSPILSLETYEIIGIHLGGNNKKNFGTFIKYAIECFKREKIMDPKQRYTFNKLIEKNYLAETCLYYDKILKKDVVIKKIKKIVNEKAINKEIIAMKEIK